jgi:glucosamine--fructose-6-phosphate aminotransferase (isomerizing)
VVIANRGSQYEKIISNIQEIKARNGKIIAIVNEDDSAISELADYVMKTPHSNEMFTPLLTSVPLQLLSYHIAVLRGCNVDQPRNLAKSVTVE